jgi:hypothetical protein
VPILSPRHYAQHCQPELLAEDPNPALATTARCSSLAHLPLLDLSLGIRQRRLGSGQAGGARLRRLRRIFPRPQLGLLLVERPRRRLQRILLRHQLPLLGRQGRQMLLGLQQLSSTY